MGGRAGPPSLPEPGKGYSLKVDLFIRKSYLPVGQGLGTKQGPSWSMAVPVCPPESATRYHAGPSRGRRKAWWAKHLHF